MHHYFKYDSGRSKKSEISNFTNDKIWVKTCRLEICLARFLTCISSSKNINRAHKKIKYALSRHFFVKIWTIIHCFSLVCAHIASSEMSILSISLRNAVGVYRSTRGKMTVQLKWFFSKNKKIVSSCVPNSHAHKFSLANSKNSLC